MNLTALFVSSIVLLGSLSSFAQESCAYLYVKSTKLFTYEDETEPSFAAQRVLFKKRLMYVPMREANIYHFYQITVTRTLSIGETFGKVYLEVKRIRDNRVLYQTSGDYLNAENILQKVPSCSILVQLR